MDARQVETRRLVVGISGATGIVYGSFVGGMPLPEGPDESRFLGALFGEGIEVTAAETVGLPVPATAEIVIEGHVAVDETAMEGPMNEYPGYNATEASPKPVLAVSAVSWREGAILPVVAACKTTGPAKFSCGCWTVGPRSTGTPNRRK